MNVDKYIRECKANRREDNAFGLNDMDINYKNYLAEKACLGYLADFKRVIVFDIDVFNKTKDKSIYRRTRLTYNLSYLAK